MISPLFINTSLTCSIKSKLASIQYLKNSFTSVLFTRIIAIKQTDYLQIFNFKENNLCNIIASRSIFNQTLKIMKADALHFTLIAIFFLLLTSITRK